MLCLYILKLFLSYIFLDVVLINCVLIAVTMQIALSFRYFATMCFYHYVYCILIRIILVLYVTYILCRKITQ